MLINRYNYKFIWVVVDDCNLIDGHLFRALRHTDSRAVTWSDIVLILVLVSPFP